MNFKLKYISVPIFLVSFALGIFAVYIYEPENKKIMVYPSPDNVDYIQYKDKANNCFQFKEQKVASCPTNVERIPIQSN
uniref:Uncharacterized protein n=1 Tax=viral metagenome TaxID=1070528 RepID=A0A6C0HJ97_9ZZZZ